MQTTNENMFILDIYVNIRVHTPTIFEATANKPRDAANC